MSIVRNTKVFFYFATCICVASICFNEAFAETATTINYDDPAYSQQRARFLRECEEAEFNSNCARFYANEISKQKSKDFCGRFPEDPGCAKFIEEQEVAEEERRAISVSREIADYCRANKTAPRCIARSKRKHRGF